MPQADNPVVPTHVGIIPDGNRRWARERDQAPITGHQACVKNIVGLVDQAYSLGVDFLSVYLFSTENWNRSDREISLLMDLLLDLFKNKLEKLDQYEPKIEIIGFRKRLSKKILEAIETVEEKTKDNDGIKVTLCLDYGGRAEIIEAVKSVVSNDMEPSSITESTFKKHMWSSNVPPIDFLIRTSGEQRLSNFMLWQAAYAEFYFPEIYWPDFTAEKFEAALEEFANRKRRYGH